MKTYVTPTVDMLFLVQDDILATTNSSEAPIGTFADKWEDLGGMF